MNTEDKFQEWLDHVCLRPAMYMGVANTKIFCAFLGGYSFGFGHGTGQYDLHGAWPVLDNFGFNWLRYKFQCNNPAWGQARILYHFHDHDHLAAIRAVAGLFKEYRQDQKFRVATDSELADLIGAAVQAKTSNKFGAPECERCKDVR